MPINLGGIIFSQVYTDNTGSGAAEFDSDGDGTATQEDEFVAVANLSGAPVDISGWQIWSDSTGTGAADAPVDGLFHTFAPGTVIGSGGSLTVINEISAGGSAPFRAIEASEGGVESGAGGTSTNLLTEGNGGSQAESVVLLNPATGEYIVFNFGPNPFVPSNIAGFPGTTNLGEVDAAAIQADPTHGFSVQYDPVTDDYVLGSVFVPCFTPGTLIAVPDGQKPVEDIREGDIVVTGSGFEVVRAVLERSLDLTKPSLEDQKPVSFAIGSLGSGRPTRPLLLSPQHRVLMQDEDGSPVLVPAKALLSCKGVRVAHGKRHIHYIQLVCAHHSVLSSEDVWTESFYPGKYALLACDASARLKLIRIFPKLDQGQLPRTAFPCLSVGDAAQRRLLPPRDMPALSRRHA